MKKKKTKQGRRFFPLLGTVIAITSIILLFAFPLITYRVSITDKNYSDTILKGLAFFFSGNLQMQVTSHSAIGSVVTNSELAVKFNGGGFSTILLLFAGSICGLLAVFSKNKTGLLSVISGLFILAGGILSFFTIKMFLEANKNVAAVILLSNFDLKLAFAPICSGIIACLGGAFNIIKPLLRKH